MEGGSRKEWREMRGRGGGELAAALHTALRRERSSPPPQSSSGDEDGRGEGEGEGEEMGGRKGVRDSPQRANPAELHCPPHSL